MIEYFQTDWVLIPAWREFKFRQFPAQRFIAASLLLYLALARKPKIYSSMVRNCASDYRRRNTKSPLTWNFAGHKKMCFESDYSYSHVEERRKNAFFHICWCVTASYIIREKRSTLLWIYIFCHYCRYHKVVYKTDALHWRHNDQDGVSNHQPHGCLLNGLFRRKSKKTSKLRVTGLCVGNSPGPVNSPHKGPVTRKMFPFDDVIMVR